MRSVIKKIFVAAVISLAYSGSISAGDPAIRMGVPRDSIVLSDPAILADKGSGMYYMTGTGGLLWKSADLATWDGPFAVAETDPASWMGVKPEIWAAELHEHAGKYYYFATFTNNSIIIERNKNGEIPRRATHVLVSDRPEGPFRPAGDKNYLPDNVPTLDGTFFVDADGKPYMVFCGEWLHNDNGTIEAIELKEDLTASTGRPRLLFRASDSPWSRETRDSGEISYNRVTDGPWLFRTATGRLGMIWTSWIFHDYTMSVAYSESGTLKGPWVQEREPLTPPNYGHGMIFKDFSGRTLLSLHSHADINGRTVRHPVLWEIDLSGDKLKLVRKLGPEYRAPLTK